GAAVGVVATERSALWVRLLPQHHAHVRVKNVGLERQLAAVVKDVELVFVDGDFGRPRAQLFGLDGLVFVGLSGQAEGIGAYAQVYVHRDEHGGNVGRIADLDRALNDGVVARVWFECDAKRWALLRNVYPQRAAVFEWNA